MTVYLRNANRAKGENAFRKSIIKILCIIEPNLDGLFRNIIENFFSNYLKYKPVTRISQILTVSIIK